MVIFFSLLPSTGFDGTLDARQLAQRSWFSWTSGFAALPATSNEEPSPGRRAEKTLVGGGGVFFFSGRGVLSWVDSTFLYFSGDFCIEALGRCHACRREVFSDGAR